MSHFDTYQQLLTNAMAVGHAEFTFWRSVVEAHQADRIDIEDIRTLMHESARNQAKPSRATAYRHLERWSDLMGDMANPGRGA